MLLLMTLTAVVVWRVQQQVAETTAVVEEDVLSTHNLVARAAARQDVELLGPLLSGRDLTWTRVQEALLSDGLLYDRTPMGLALIPTTADDVLTPDDARLVALTVSPELNEAVVQFVQEYTPVTAVEEGPPIALQQTAVYRQGRLRWLMAPPDDAFWGEWQTATSDYLTVTYPARDAGLVARLMADWTADLADFCQSDAFTCLPNWQIELRLDTQAESLGILQDEMPLLRQSAAITLPTPTLVGLPLDDASYDALRRGYTAYLLTAAIADRAEWVCCDHVALVKVLVDYELYRQGWRAWPVTAVSYGDVVNQGVNLEDIYLFWIDQDLQRLQGADGWQVYAFVDFVLRQFSHHDPVALMNSLNGNDRYYDWLRVLSGQQGGQGAMLMETLSREWWLYANARRAASQGTRPLDLPEQELQLLCTNELDDTAVPRTVLYRHNLNRESWQVQEEAQGFGFMNPLPDDTAVTLQWFFYGSENWQTQIQSAAENWPLPLDDSTFSLGQSDPLGQYLLVYLLNEEVSEPTAHLLDMMACRAGDCTTTPLGGLPVWSPNGTETLFTEISFAEQSQLFLAHNRVMLDESLPPGSLDIYLANRTADVASRQWVGNGFSPFWIDSTRFGWIQVESGQEVGSQIESQTLVMGSTEQEGVRPIVTTEGLLTALPAEERPLHLMMHYVLVRPQDPDTLVVMAGTRNAGYLFLVNWVTGQVSYRLPIGFSREHFLGFSPDGRYLLVSGSQQNRAQGFGAITPVYLHDIDANATQTFSTGINPTFPSYPFDWSADGRWLAFVLNQGTINLIAPEYGYQQLILHELGNCQSLAWVNPMGEQ
jgi:hypothetical protein